MAFKDVTPLRRTYGYCGPLVCRAPLPVDGFVFRLRDRLARSDSSQLEASDFRPVRAFKGMPLLAVINCSPHDNFARGALLDVNDVHSAVLHCSGTTFLRSRGL